MPSEERARAVAYAELQPLLSRREPTLRQPQQPFRITGKNGVLLRGGEPERLDLGDGLVGLVPGAVAREEDLLGAVLLDDTAELFKLHTAPHECGIQPEIAEFSAERRLHIVPERIAAQMREDHRRIGEFVEDDRRHLRGAVDLRRADGVESRVENDRQPQLAAFFVDREQPRLVHEEMLVVGVELDAVESERFDALQLCQRVLTVRVDAPEGKDVVAFRGSRPVVAEPRRAGGAAL